MARNPWDEDPELKAMRSSMRPQRGSTPWAGLVVGVALVACGTFVFAYYVPLYRAHQTLASSHGRIMGQIKALEDTLTQAQASLKSEIARRETLEAEKRQREAREKSLSGDTEGTKATLQQKLDKAIQKKQAAVAVDGERVVVAFASSALFSTGKVDVSGAGKTLLCDVANVAGSRNLHVEGATGDSEVPALLKPKYPNAWALSAAAAATVAETLASKCSVPGARLSATGYANEKAPRKAFETAKLSGLRVEIEIGGQR